MTDYEKLNALLDEYTTELQKRKEGVHSDVWDYKTGKFQTSVVVPNNKAKLNRLRIEIASTMLRIERQMTETTGGAVGKEGWC